MAHPTPVQIVDLLPQLKILVIGDIMLDRYVHGEVTRVAPEAPVPVLNITHEEVMLGGAGNVIANLRGLGVKTSIIAMIGMDEAGQKIKNLCDEKNIATEGLIVVSDRPTTQKTRYIGNGQVLIRADQENSSAIECSNETSLLEAISNEIQNADAVILSDYLKGVLTENIIQAAIRKAGARDIPVLVDPKRKDCSIYKGANVITPNLKELAAASGLPVDNDADVQRATTKLLSDSGIAAAVVTRSERGASVMADKSQNMEHIPNTANIVRGVSGAGDTFVATLAVGLAAGLDLVSAAQLANKACGIVVAAEGTTSINSAQLFASDINFSHAPWISAKAQIDEWKTQGLKVGFTNGCFDILHAGHVTYLQEAASYCDRLVVGLNHDNSVRILKGPTRPVNEEASRATVLSGLGAVDLVVLFGAENSNDDNTPCGLLRYIQPDIIFKGGDYTEDQLPEAKVVRAYGGDVKIMGLVDGKSTTNIIKKIAAV